MEISCGKNKILVAEDDRDLCFAIKSLLSSLGFSVVTAFDGAQALICAKGDFAAMIIGDTIPRIPAEEVVSLVRSKYDAPMIRIAETSEIDENYLASQCGFNGFLPRPFSPEDLKSELLGVMEDMEKPEFNVGDVTVFPSRKATYNGTFVYMTRAETKLLEKVSKGEKTKKNSGVEYETFRSVNRKLEFLKAPLRI